MTYQETTLHPYPFTCTADTVPTAYSPLYAYLENSGVNREVLSSPKVVRNLRVLLERAQSARRKVFLIETERGIVPILAASPHTIDAVRLDIQRFSRFQSRLQPELVQGKCVYLHKRAYQEGVVDTIWTASDSKDPHGLRALYPIQGIHHIATYPHQWRHYT